MAEKLVRIGGASGAWGDSPGAIEQLLGAGVHYFMMDYLAEVTMSLLARARMKDPEAGFPPDFVGYLKRYLAEIARQGIKVASNGGGVNPASCKRALEAAITELGLSLKVAMIEGDDVMPLTDALRDAGLREHVSGETLPKRLLTANAYLGALPIKAAFDGGADIVITGRCADSALALGILMHEFGWSAADYDMLGAGSLVGHILECGPQATGRHLHRLGQGSRLAQYRLSDRRVPRRRQLHRLQAGRHRRPDRTRCDCGTVAVRSR